MPLSELVPKGDDAIFFWFFLSLLVFLLVREIFCWYWKINQRVSLLEQSLETQKRILKTTQEIAQFIQDKEGMKKEDSPSV